MRIKWFTVPLVIVVLLACYFVTWFIVSGLYALITANWVIAAFSIVLATATIWNIFISSRLLKESKTASKQSRAAFLADIVVRTLDLEEKVIEQWSPGKSLFEAGRGTVPGSLTEDIARMLGNIDETLRTDFLKAWGSSEGENED